MSSLPAKISTLERTEARSLKRLITDHEAQVLALVLGGYDNSEIASQLAVSKQTVKRDLTGLLRKMGVKDRLELVLFATHHKLIPSKGRRR